MSKRKGSSKRKQAQHKRKSNKSQHDKRERLQRPNPKRKKTTKAKVALSGAMQAAVLVLQTVLDRRIAFRFSILDPRRWDVAVGISHKTRAWWRVADLVRDESPRTGGRSKGLVSGRRSLMRRDRF